MQTFCLQPTLITDDLLNKRRLINTQKLFLLQRNVIFFWKEFIKSPKSMDTYQDKRKFKVEQLNRYITSCK